jgi:hypothetical protein
VVRDSEVAIAAELTSFDGAEFIHEAKRLTLGDVGTPCTGTATLAGSRDDVEAALIAAFGAGAVTRHPPPGEWFGASRLLDARGRAAGPGSYPPLREHRVMF